MPYKRKTWKEKLQDDKDLPKVVKIDIRMNKRWGSGTIAIPAPREVDEAMRSVPRGKLTTINQIREKVAIKHGATIGCPICTGIFANIAAHAAEEDAAAGRKDITPYWRTLKSKGELNEKYPGGTKRQSERLRKEGHTILTTKGKKPPTVRDYEKKLV